MVKKETTLVVKKTLTGISGITNIVDGRNAHGPTVTFDCMGMEWEYGYDGSPKGTYDVAKTRKGIMHMMLAKAPSGR